MAKAAKRDPASPDPRREKRGRRIVKARRAKGWSQNDLAVAVGTHPTLISKYERGVFSPGAEMTFKLADALEVDARWLAMVEKKEAA